MRPERDDRAPALPGGALDPLHPADRRLLQNAARLIDEAYDAGRVTGGGLLPCFDTSHFSTASGSVAALRYSFDIRRRMTIGGLAADA